MLHQVPGVGAHVQPLSETELDGHASLLGDDCVFFAVGCRGLV
jgi:hypothetical protein